MPKEIKRNKIFYIDTNIVLDYITGRNVQTISVLEKIKNKGWKCISSSFLTMEVADYKKDNIFLFEKAMEKKWEMRKIFRETYKKDLKSGDFDKVLDWFLDFLEKYNLELFDFLINTDNWFLAQNIAFNSNLSAPDVVHLASAIIGATNKQCQVLITNDNFFTTEANKVLLSRGLNKKLKIMTTSEVEKQYFYNSRKK
ncbi:MAG: hypothetical protein Q7S77_02685 [Candidatus Staskawiczbacteria bacterium]|nr:hypothetical protein [Candidatus Staskawiczbacteria bacterium]